MANLKQFLVANVGSVDYHILSGTQANLDIEMGKVDSTNFANVGQDKIKSYEGTLKSGSISSNAKWAGSPGYKAIIKTTKGINPVTSKPMALIAGTTNMFSITDAALNSWAIAGGIKVYNDGTELTESQIEWVDFLHGIVKLPDTFTAGVITVDVSVRVFTELCNAKEFTLSTKTTAEAKDTFCSAKNANGYKSFTSGFNEVTLEVKSFYEDNTEDEDLLVLLDTQEPIMIELVPDGIYGSYVRGMFILTKQGFSGDIGKPEELSLTYDIYAEEHSLKKSTMQWYHTPESTLNKGIKACLDAWTNNESVLYKWYPKGQGSKGRAGAAILTDFSLSVGLEKQSEFTASLQATGAIVVLAT